MIADTTGSRLFALRSSVFATFLLVAVSVQLVGNALTIPFISTGSLGVKRYGHTATLLPNGKVLVAGGIGFGTIYLSIAEIYDPSNGTWTAAGTMGTARAFHTATLLPDGRLLVAGGRSASTVVVSNADIYDPSSGTWTATGSLGTARALHVASLLPDGKVLVAGGQSGRNAAFSDVEIYDPSAGTWIGAESMVTARFGHAATLLLDGRVLVSGGYGDGAYQASAEIFDPLTGTWTTTGTMGTRRANHTATPLSGGRVLVAGGYNYTGGSVYLSTAELYDPSNGMWTATGSMGTPRAHHAMTLLPDGRVFVAGGNNGTNYLAGAELYDLSNGMWAAVGLSVYKKYYHTASLLPNGKVIEAGGEGPGAGGVGPLLNCDLYGCRVSFDAAGGTATQSTKVYYLGTDAYGMLPMPFRPGYLFGGWWTGAGGSGARVSDVTALTAASDHTLYANWNANAYTVTFDAGAGTVDPTNKAVTFDAAYGELPEPARTGYSFAGWRANTNGVVFGVDSNSVVTIASDHTLAASWNANAYTVTFDAGAGTVDPTNKAVTFDAAYGELPEPARAGYSFAGWRANTNGVVFGVDSNTVVAVANDHTLAAAWNANAYTVTFDPQGGEVSPANKAVTFDAAYGALPVPVLTAPIRVDYSFGGWFTGSNGTGLVVTETMTVSTASGHTLYAKWVPAPYVCTPDEDAALATSGSYDGYFYSEGTFGDDAASVVRGTLTLKITRPSGKLTAKAVVQKGSLSFSAEVWTAAESDGRKRATLRARGGETLDLYVRQNRVWGTLTGGSLGGETFTLDGARNRFGDRAYTAAQTLLNSYRGYYTVALPVRDRLSLGAANIAPEGSGYLTITVGYNGGALIAGRLADGTPVSQSSRLILFGGCGPEACVPFFAPLYARKGWAGGLLWIDPASRAAVTDRDLGWFVRWVKPDAGLGGFSELLDACGGYYSRVESLAAHYLFSAETNGVPYRYNGGVADIQPVFPSNVAVTANGSWLNMTRGVKPVLADGVYDYSAENSSMATLSFSSWTGIFKGKFRVYYDYAWNGLPQHKVVSVRYAGVLTPVRDEVYADQPAGQGYYVMPGKDHVLSRFRLNRSYPVYLDAEP